MKFGKIREILNKRYFRNNNRSFDKSGIFLRRFKCVYDPSFFSRLFFSLSFAFPTLAPSRSSSPSLHLYLSSFPSPSISYGHFQGVGGKTDAAIRDRTRDLKIFSLTLSQLSYYSCAWPVKIELYNFATNKLVFFKEICYFCQYFCYCFENILYSKFHGFFRILK